MNIEVKTITLPKQFVHEIDFAQLENKLNSTINPGQRITRFVIVGEHDSDYFCELDVVDSKYAVNLDSIFTFRFREKVRTQLFNAVMIVPTGIGCIIGGHAGDATPVAKLLASVCDILILHPNVVNASDINEQPENALYVEGSVLSQLLMGTVSLSKVRANKILLVTEQRNKASWITDNIVNCASASMATMGTNISKILILKKPFTMKTGFSKSGRAIGEISNLENLISILNDEIHNFDAIAIASKIETHIDSLELHKQYFSGNSEMINPWGGIEASLTHFLSSLYKKASAHAPSINNPLLKGLQYGIVDPRKAAEVFSTTYLFCILKGLHKSPKISKPILYSDPSVVSTEDISCLITPYGVIGTPILAALAQDIPIIAIRENKNIINCTYDDMINEGKRIFVVANYFEAVGVMCAIKAGVSIKSISRPINLPIIEYK